MTNCKWRITRSHLNPTAAEDGPVGNDFNLHKNTCQHVWIRYKEEICNILMEYPAKLRCRTEINPSRLLRKKFNLDNQREGVTVLFPRVQR